jgi:NAD-dependent deacetylase
MNKEIHRNYQEELIKKTAKAISDSKKTIALTGAGISVASGIPPFRGKGGLWEKYNPDEYAHVTAFLEDPKKVWIMLKEMIDTILPAKPNSAHVALFELEEMGFLSGIITGNVDSLHQAAGSKNVWELHGSNRSLICMKCNRTYPIERYQKEMPPRCECGFALRPDVVLFGEQLPQDVLFGSYALAKECELMLVVGTSSVVSPMSHMPFYTKENHGKVVEVNLEETYLSSSVSDWIITGKVEEILPKIAEEVKKL